MNRSGKTILHTSYSIKLGNSFERQGEHPVSQSCWYLFNFMSCKHFAENSCICYLFREEITILRI